MKQEYLFYISNNIQNYKVKYYTNRLNKHLCIEKPIKSYWIEDGDDKKHKLDKIMLDILFGSECKKVEQKYRMFIQSLQQIPIDIHLKSSISVAKVILNKKRWTLNYISVNCSPYISLQIPKILSFTICGTHKQQKIYKTVAVTEAMQRELNLPALMKYYVKKRLLR